MFIFSFSALQLFLLLKHRLILNEQELTLHTFWYKKTISLNQVAFVTMKYVHQGRRGRYDVCLLDKNKKELLSFHSKLIMQRNYEMEGIECLRFIQKASQAKLSTSLQKVFPLFVHHIPTDEEIPMMRRLSKWTWVILIFLFTPLFNIFYLF